jgi:hypothetical protein
MSDPSKAIGLVFTIVKELTPIVVDLIQRGMSGEDITHDELFKRLPGELQTTIQAEMREAARKAAGLPT